MKCLRDNRNAAFAKHLPGANHRVQRGESGNSQNGRFRATVTFAISACCIAEGSSYFLPLSPLTNRTATGVLNAAAVLIRRVKYRIKPFRALTPARRAAGGNGLNVIHVRCRGVDDKPVGIESATPAATVENTPPLTPGVKQRRRIKRAHRAWLLRGSVGGDENTPTDRGSHP